MHSATKPLLRYANARAPRAFVEGTLQIGTGLQSENARDPSAFLKDTFEIGSWLQSENARDSRAFSTRTFAIATWRGHFIDTVLCTPWILMYNVS